MKVDLLPHNQEAYEKIRSEIENGKRKLALSHATGTGKSYLIAKLFEDYSEDKKLVLIPSLYIKDQIEKIFQKYSIQNADVVLYQKLIKMTDEEIAAMDYSMIALDEYHHDTSKIWGKKVRRLLDTHMQSLIFGTSATPVRSDGVNTIDELFKGNCVSELPLSECIAKKIVPLPKYVGALYKLDDELEKLRKKVENATNTKEEKEEFYKKINTMRSQIEKSYGMPIILNKHIKDKESKYIVFCKNKRHLREIKNTVIGWFKTAGFKDINAYEVYSDYENKNEEYNAFCDDKSHSLDLLFCVDMLNEGLHLENISGVLLLRPTRSSIVWHQQIGRAIEANNTNTPVIIDAVNNFSSVKQGVGLLKEIKNAIAREKEKDPSFDDGGLEDIDTFFVLEQILEIQEMFREIEERLEGSWDLHIKALTQYKEREGNCDVPGDHVEIVDGVELKLGLWCINLRSSRNKIRGYSLTNERIKQLDEIGFIWDTLLYKWENGLKHFDKYVEKHNGDVLVPTRYVDEDGFPLGGWVCRRRGELDSLPEYKVAELNKRGFVWDVLKYRFENNIKAVAEYYEKYEKYPVTNSKDSEIKKLGIFINCEKKKMRDKDIPYPEWKVEILNKYLPDFSCEYKSDKSFDEFIYYTKLYKKRYGHLNIGCKDVINGYNIGTKRNTLSCCKSLSENQKKELEYLGVYFGNKLEKQFDDKMDLVKQAINEGVIIGRKNQKYKDKNLYIWIMVAVKNRYKNNKLSLSEIQIIEKLVGKSLDDLYCGKNEPIKVKVIDIVEKKEVGIFKSLKETARRMKERYDIKISCNVIRYRLTGKIITPYKGRFMFYRVDENEEVTE